MSILTARTRRLIERSFGPDLQERIAARLGQECGPEALGCAGWTPEQMERIWFAVLKLGRVNPERLEKALLLARTDWRDLLMAAGFGEDVNAHNKWWADNAP